MKPAETGHDAGGHPPLRRLIVFALIFCGLQWAWSTQQDGALFDLWVEGMNVGAAVAVIDTTHPEAAAEAAGTRILAPGGGINVLQGCDGAELLWLITAAFAVAPLTWRWRLGGWLIGMGIAWLLNLGRIVALFFAFRADPQWFDWIHNYVGPVVLIVLLALFFQAWMHYASEPVAKQDAPF